MFYHIFPCFLLELTLSSGERRKRERVVQKKGILTYPSCSGLFCFFLSFVDCIPVFSFSFSPPPPRPLPLVFFREGKTLLSSRLEFFSSAYLAIILFSSSSHHYHHQSSWVSWKRLCKSHIPPSLPFPSLAFPCLYDLKNKKEEKFAELSNQTQQSSRNESMKDDPQEIYNWRVFVLCASVSPTPHPFPPQKPPPNSPLKKPTS